MSLPEKCDLPTLLHSYLPTCLPAYCLPAYLPTAYLPTCTGARVCGRREQRVAAEGVARRVRRRRYASHLLTFLPSYLPTAPPRSDFTSTCRCVDRASTGGAMCACVQRCTFRVCCVGRVSSASDRQWSLKCHRVVIMCVNSAAPTRNAGESIAILVQSLGSPRSFLSGVT